MSKGLKKDWKTPSALGAWGFNIALWIASIYFFALGFQLSDSLENIDWYFSLLFHISILFVVELNLKLLIPRFLQKRKFGAYFSSLAIILVLGVLLNDLSFDQIANWIFPTYFFIGYLEYWEISMYLGIYAVLSTLMKLSFGWFNAEKQRIELVQKERERLNEELSTLKAQINPHFLFNNLNMLYALAVKQDHSLPEHLLQLSDLLRYVLYQTNVSKVSLSSEIKLIQDYIELSKKRMDPNSEVILELNPPEEEVLIPPLLFLPLLENAFKHGLFGRKEASVLHIWFRIKGDKIEFGTRNQLPDGKEKSDGGVGLSNLEQRLSRLFPNAYNLNKSMDNESFECVLTLNLDGCVV